jgi:hypothetical protein
MLCENSNVAGCYSRCRNVSSKLNDSSFRIVAAAGERRAVARLRRRDEDRFMDKYTPDRRISALRRLSVALHLALPAFGLTFIWGWSAETGREHWFSWLVCAAAYLIYAVFAILLHKEHYPERSAIAARLAFAPLVLSGLYFKFLDPSFLGWLVAAGLAYFFGVSLAIWTLFAFGSRLAPVDATAGPGQSRLRWRPDGRSPLLDPQHSPAARLITAVVFVAPGLLAAPAVLGRAFGGEGANAIWPIVALLAAAGFQAWQVVRQLVGMVTDGRFFGPGKTAFD